MPLRPLIVCSLLLTVASATADPRFSNDPRQAFRLAHEQGRPLLVYLNTRPGRSSAGRLRESRVFQDATVTRLSRLFICLEIHPNKVRNELNVWGLSANTSGYVVFVAPDKQRLHGSRVDDITGFVDDLVTARRAYGQFIWEKELRGPLQRSNTRPNELRDILQRVVQFDVRAADRSVGRLLRRPDLNAATRQEALRTLAKLSTRPAVETLADHARYDSQARAALVECTPVAAEHLAEWLGHGPALRDEAIYVALCKIAKVRARRRLDFWESGDPDARREEISWIRGKITALAMRSYTNPE